MKSTTKLIGLLLLFQGLFTYGQMEQYHYRRELKGISGPWHKIMLPDEVFGKISKDLTDIRIFGITADHDTVEAPYLLRLKTGSVTNKDVLFKMLNTSHNDHGYYFTFEIPTKEAINQIKLDFKQNNFDWRIRLEGSQNQNDWFTVMENYRILSIKNVSTDFQFTKLAFPDSKYRFFRLFIDTKEKPELKLASLSQQEISEATYRNYAVKKVAIKEKKDTKQTEIAIKLKRSVPVSFLHIEIKDSFDYYRPITIKYVTDSTKTEKGWKYHDQTLASGTLNSIEKNELKCPSTTVKKLKIIIDNQDNQPLTIGAIQVKGYAHELLARFTKPATYFLTYGSNQQERPQYDIERFTDKLPVALTPLELGEELTIEKEKTSETSPLFKNRIWLWLIMGLIILVLGWFSIKMMRKE